MSQNSWKADLKSVLLDNPPEAAEEEEEAGARRPGDGCRRRDRKGSPASLPHLGFRFGSFLSLKSFSCFLQSFGCRVGFWCWMVQV